MKVKVTSLTTQTTLQIENGNLSVRPTLPAIVKTKSKPKTVRTPSKKKGKGIRPNSNSITNYFCKSDPLTQLDQNSDHGQTNNTDSFESPKISTN